jgi:PadR family transcriptional regulator, regulatory protein PadR
VPRPFKITDNVVAVFNQMLHPVGKPWYGLELAAAANVGHATIYNVLTRLERAELLTASWESATASELGRPQRRLYTLTPEGEQVAREAIASYRPKVTIVDRGGFLPGLIASKDSP